MIQGVALKKLPLGLQCTLTGPNGSGYTGGMASHRDCTHPKTKTARAKCRRFKAEGTDRVETDYGTFEIKTITAREITRNDMVLYRSPSLPPFFVGVLHSAFQVEEINRAGEVKKTDTWRIVVGTQPKFVPGDTEYEVAVEPQEVRTALQRHRRMMHDRLNRR